MFFCHRDYLCRLNESYPRSKTQNGEFVDVDLTRHDLRKEGCGVFRL